MRRARLGSCFLPELFQLDEIGGTQKPALPSASLCRWDTGGCRRSSEVAGQRELNQSPQCSVLLVEAPVLCWPDTGR